ncbi:MAG: GNAT family N-acetyltransferase [Actinomycetia bacterium]|nr:GNAT family N-acetyltransferase [Actinomycetes bacterium]
MTLRVAGPADADLVGALTAAAYVADGFADPQRTPGYFASLSDGETRIAQATVLIAEEEGIALGTATAAIAGSPYAHIALLAELEVRMIAVSPDHRRRGVGRALLAGCEQLARDRGLPTVVLSTEPAQQAAHRLYEALGYQRAPERDWQIEDVELLVYRKDLARHQVFGPGQGIH